ncbi:hypothetical protein C8Q76DRAFT_763787 [Earliella scabrosa]|nr:hypothetical protein C8Q76DRAFT_763787 [Earliella scabrosa]
MAAIRPTSLTDTMLRLCGHLALALIRSGRSCVPLQPKPGPSPVSQSADPRVAGVYGARESAAAPTSHLLDPNPEVVLDVRPDLHHFRADGYFDYDLSLLPWHNLQSLQLHVVDHQIWPLICSLPSLSDLSIVEYTTRSSEAESSNMPPIQGCAALQRLSTSGSPPSLLHMMSSISSPFLIVLSLGIEAIFHARDAFPFLDTMFALRAFQPLREVDLYIPMEVGDPFTDGSGERMEIEFADLARALLPLRQLEAVSIEVRRRTISLSDADIARIGSSWPGLRQLKVAFDTPVFIQKIWQPAGVDITRPSLTCLVDYALSHPQLEKLDVEVASVSEDDLVYLETVAATALSPVNAKSPRSRLRWLTFAREDHRTSIELPDDHERLARALNRLFPRLGGLERAPADRFSTDGSVSYVGWSHSRDLKSDCLCFLKELERLGQC